MKKHRRFLILFMLFALLSSWNCSLINSIGSSDTGNSPSDSSVTDPGGSDDEDVVNLVDGPLAPPELIFPSLGSIAFDVDTSTTTSAEFMPGQETVLELTDGGGLTWTLTLPMNAIDTPQSIKMTVLSNVRSQDVPGSLLGGLLLEPDGLEFYVPAVLRVSGEEAGGPRFLLTGQQDGTAIEPAYMEETPGSALLYHFSSVFISQADQEKTMEEMYQSLDASEKALIQEVKALLKDRNINVPVPPSIPVECTSKEAEAANQKLMEQFNEAVYNPEGPLIGKLLAIKRGKALLGREYDELFSLENRLLNRLVKKVRLLLKTYYGQEEKLVPVAGVALQVARNVALLSPSTDYTEKPLFLEEIGDWSESLIDKLLESARTEHDYRKASAVWKMAYWASLLGNQNKTVEEIKSRLERVFRFQMKLQLNIGIVGESEYELQGEFPIGYRAQDMKLGMLTGAGQANMTSAKFTSDDGWFVESAPFAVNAIITDFDPCASTAYLTIDRFYPDVETHFSRDAQGEVMEIGEMTLVKIAWGTLYDDRKKTGPAWFSNGLESTDQYTFQLKLRNKDVTAVDDNIESTDPQPGGTLDGTFKVELIHSPK